jgi:hypothetical protein
MQVEADEGDDDVVDVDWISSDCWRLKKLRLRRSSLNAMSSSKCFNQTFQIQIFLNNIGTLSEWHFLQMNSKKWNIIYAYIKK